MLRVLLACMVPLLAIGLTGLLVTSIGRTLLALSSTAATLLALLMTIVIMGGCTIAARAADRRAGARATDPPHH